MNTGRVARCPMGATPPIANPVSRLTRFGSARTRSAPTSRATDERSAIRSPAMSRSTNADVSTLWKTSDFTIWPTLQPQARAASSAVRVLSGMSRISTAKPAALAARMTRSVLPPLRTPVEAPEEEDEAGSDLVMSWFLLPGRRALHSARSTISLSEPNAGQLKRYLGRPRQQWNRVHGARAAVPRG